MIFWDASALAKGYANEVGTPSVLGALKASRGRGFVTEFVALEVLTVFAKWFREGRLTKGGHKTAVAEFFRDYPNAFSVIDVDENIRGSALNLAQALRGKSLSSMDVLHLASTLHLQKLVTPRRAILASADIPLLKAAQSKGLATFNPETEPLGHILTLLR